MIGDLLAALAPTAALMAILTFPLGRSALRRHLLATRRMFIEWPLRRITGRWPASETRTRALELNLGMREPTPLEASVEQFNAAIRASGISASDYWTEEGDDLIEGVHVPDDALIIDREHLALWRDLAAPTEKCIKEGD